MRFDTVVIGGGHAGCEAAAAAARLGVTVALVTPRLSDLGAMSCNPAIGGIGKGHLVREVDVFDGLIATAVDRAGIHYRMLNKSKGSAVRGPRVQADRMLYGEAISALIAAQANLTLVIGEVDHLQVTGGVVEGVRLIGGAAIISRAVVLATGTFLSGRVFTGLSHANGGRRGEAGSGRLDKQVRELGLVSGRLKTGTPPRLDGRTIDWARIGRQRSDDENWSMSAMSRRSQPQIACGITRTNRTTHDIIRDGLVASPVATGSIEGRGPRYCPSIEDKVVRFADRESHHIFLEPEGLRCTTVYPNGISTSLPVEAQQAFVRTIEGLERSQIVWPGYAVEYDFADPRRLDARLHVRDVPGLFLAGQINGTTGYEEAAAQGLVAGLNAAAEVAGESPIFFDRAISYIGVMLDDLTLHGVSEPYRMLTARAEYRLSLRSDNAPTRLGELAIASGAVSERRLAWLHDRRDRLARVRELVGAGALHEAERDDLTDEVEEDVRYAPYLLRQQSEIARIKEDERVQLGGIRRFSGLPGLSTEMVERLEAARPATLAAAGRISGITPAALTALLLAARRAAA